MSLDKYSNNSTLLTPSKTLAINANTVVINASSLPAQGKSLIIASITGMITLGAYSQAYNLMVDTGLVPVRTFTSLNDIPRTGIIVAISNEP